MSLGILLIACIMLLVAFSACTAANKAWKRFKAALVFTLAISCLGIGYQMTDKYYTNKKYAKAKESIMIFVNDHESAIREQINLKKDLAKAKSKKEIKKISREIVKFAKVQQDCVDSLKILAQDKKLMANADKLFAGHVESILSKTDYSNNLSRR